MTKTIFHKLRAAVMAGLFIVTSSMHAEPFSPIWSVRSSVAGGDYTAVDSAGNVIVAGGRTSGNGDYYTAKYAAITGALLWERFYNGPANGADSLYGMAVDSGGNVVVTGVSSSDCYTAKYASADGALIWEKRVNIQGFLNDVAVDGDGNAIVTGMAATYDWYTAKYAAADGALLWETRSTLGGYGPSNVAVDSAGNVAVTGTALDDFYTIKYAAAGGAVLWGKRYSSPVYSVDRATCVAMDSAGNVFVTGNSASSDQQPDYYTAKYASADGALLWEKRYNGPANKGDYPIALAVDGAGNVAVTGTSTATGNLDNAYTAKYAAADGALMWERRYTNTAGARGAGITADNAGNIFITGNSSNAVSTDFYTAKYAAADGATVWEAFYNGLGYGTNTMLSGSFIRKKIAITPDGGAVITGMSQGLSNFDYVTIKYLPTDGDNDGLRDSWEVANFGTTAASTPTGDNDGDGRVNLLELAFGTSPTVPNISASPVVVNEGGFLTITLTKNPGVTYSVESSATPDDASFSPATTTVITNTATTLKTRDNFTITNASKRFLRVKVTAAP